MRYLLFVCVALSSIGASMQAHSQFGPLIPDRDRQVEPRRDNRAQEERRREEDKRREEERRRECERDRNHCR